MHRLRACLSMLLVSCIVTQEQHKVCMVVPETTTRCFQRFRGTPISDMAAKVSCLQDLFWDFSTDSSLTGGDMSYFRKLTGENRTQWDQISPKWRANGVVHAALSARATNLSSPARWREMPRLVEVNLYPPSGYRVRREYRTMTISERDALHRALRIMNINGEIQAFARLYAKAVDTHHGGASFLPWNRMFLMLFEEAMLKHEPDVFLPYWASTLDDAMKNPVTSLLWTPEYLGNGHGDVYTGPAANWVTRQGYLQREFGHRSRLLKKSDIHTILSECRIKDIQHPTADWNSNIEYLMGGPLLWVGGDMSGFRTSGYDPVFYMHITYIDYIWEQFRKRQRSVCGVDPAEDYPKVSPDSYHAADVKMLGFPWWTNKDGLKAQWTDNWYSYKDSPECPNCCPGCPEPAPIRCDYARNICVGASMSRENMLLHLPSPGRVSHMQRPRNRGRQVHGPPSDGRTLFTAQRDVKSLKS